ncbi:MAG: SDR family NAD(P)-dependent oxidoreductase [Gammaproteobacteria bacterium]|nr:SDR family NAD(P)-dependent oxidoreductase [Gammaproteobacteria bacterium]MCY4210608.1 SDR family NAD(P)-dependent oxidoreductase [Gammaproteobacteria bacterium]MCY4337179.1 SDR family NAD(P)-dependent oxidoreductase [Gammaproteobacteria bacterium]
MTKNLIITGGSKGIGLATTELFREHGYRIINLSRSPAPPESVVNLTVDLCEPDWDQAAAAELHALIPHKQHIVLVHNAALLGADSALDLTAATLRQVLQINLVAPVQLNRLLLPLMEPGSAVLYVGSTLSVKAVPNTCSYSVSKHALAGLMRATCQDLAGSGIHTACICPGLTETDMLRELAAHNAADLAELAQKTAMGRLIDPAEIAATLYFCAAHPVMNGAVVQANLGQLQR